MADTGAGSGDDRGAAGEALHRQGVHSRMVTGCGGTFLELLSIALANALDKKMQCVCALPGDDVVRRLPEANRRRTQLGDAPARMRGIARRGDENARSALLVAEDDMCRASCPATTIGREIGMRLVPSTTQAKRLRPRADLIRMPCLAVVPDEPELRDVGIPGAPIRGDHRMTGGVHSHRRLVDQLTSLRYRPGDLRVLRGDRQRVWLGVRRPPRMTFVRRGGVHDVMIRRDVR